MNKVILIAAAGTGGHIRPAWVLGQQARARGYDVVWVGSERDVWRPQEAWPRLDLKMRGVRHQGWKAWCFLPWRLLRAVWTVLVFMRRHRPSCAILMGGYVTLPVAVAAFLLRIPYVLFEQNTVLCLSHRVALPWAKRAYTGLPLGAPDPRVSYIGNPIPDAWRPALHVSGARVRILIAGGSLGASHLNRSMPSILAPWHQQIEVVHVCGAEDTASIQRAYDDFGLSARCLPYQESMASWMAWADCAIMRAGAMTVSESMCVQLPCIWVPYPRASDQHQWKNARYVTDLGAGCVVLEDEHFEGSMQRALEQMCDVKTLVAMRAQLEALNYHFDEQRFWSEVLS